jgi:predicted Zn-dependent peptidase
MIKRHYPSFHEEVLILKLKNGMQVHILPKEDPYYSTYVELSIPYGALDLNYQVGDQTFETPYGTAHFLEHKVFAMPDGDAFAMFSKMGVDANAMTSYNQTSYLFMATHHVTEALTYLLKMIDTHYVTHDNVESEKSIIAEELKMYLDDPNVVMHNTLMEHLYFNHPIRYDIGGTLESIQRIDDQILNHVYDSFYQPSNRLIVMAGKVDVQEMVSFFKTYDQENPIKHVKPKTRYPKEPKRVRVKYHVEEKPIGISKMMIGFKLDVKRLNPKDQIKREMAMAMMTQLLLGPSSSMFESLLREGLINQQFSMSTNIEKNAESITLYAESNHIFKLKKRLVAFLTGEGEQALTEDAFNRYKKVFLGQFIYALNNVEHKAYLYGKYYHLGSNLFEVVDLLQEVTLLDAIAIYRELTPQRLSILIYKKA